MYSINQIYELQRNPSYLKAEGDRFCLVDPFSIVEYTEEHLENQANFCVLQTIRALKNKYIDSNIANFIINKIDAVQYSSDMIGIENAIKKLNKEIIEEELHTPHFNYICVICEDLYDSYQ